MDTLYFNGKLIGDICYNELFLKRTPTSDRLLADSELRYPYEGSKDMMHAFDRFEDMDLITELLKVNRQKRNPQCQRDKQASTKV